MTNKLNDTEKSRLFDTICINEYDDLILLDPASDIGVTLYAKDDIWKQAENIHFHFENALEKYILLNSADSDPRRVLKSMDTEIISRRLQDAAVYRVRFTFHDSRNTSPDSSNPETSVRLKEAAFYRYTDDSVLMSIRDITDSYLGADRQTEELKRALARANAEIQKRNAFLELLDHNLRTPLYSIIGLSRIAHDTVESGMSTNALDSYLHKISLSGTYMSDIIDNIVDLHHIANGNLQLKPADVSIGGILEKARHHIQSSITDHGLIFRSDTSEVSSLYVHTDPRCFLQIIQKLLQSALGYSVQGGRIVLRAQILSHTKAYAAIRFSVEILGIVIDQKRLNSMFAFYDQLKNHPDQSLDAGIENLDMNLLLLKHYASALNANELRCESEDNTGTSISVTLPLKLSEESSLPSEPVGSQTNPGPITDFTGRCVLLAEDDEINMAVGSKLLTSRGIRVIKASNGKEALDKYIHNFDRIDLIILDVLMPEMDGLEAARQIRSMHHIPDSGRIPIIALTADTLQEGLEKSLRSGVNAHLYKPIEPELLYRTIGQLMSEFNRENR